jgi:predicted ATPase
MTAPEVASVYDRARRLARETGRSVELFQTLWGSSIASLSSGDMRSATALKDELLVLAREQQSEELLLQAHHIGWTIALLQGDLRAGLNSIEAGLPLYRRDAHGHHALLYGGHDPGACGHAFAGMILALGGRLDRARSEAMEAISLARSLAHHGSLGHAYQFACETHYLRRDAAALDEIVREMLPFAAEHGSAVAVAHARMVHGWVLIAGGHVAEGLAALRDGLSAFRRTGSKMFGAFRLSRAADGLLLAGEIDEALSVLAEAAALAAETGDRSEIHVNVRPLFWRSCGS